MTATCLRWSLLALLALHVSVAYANDDMGDLGEGVVAGRGSQLLPSSRRLLGDHNPQVLQVVLADAYNNYTVTTCDGSNHSRFLPGPDIASVATSQFDPSLCGQCMKVTCLSGTRADSPHCNRQTPSVVVIILDECADDCGGNLFELSLPAFEKIADPDAGSYKVIYESVACPNATGQ